MNIKPMQEARAARSTDDTIKLWLVATLCLAFLGVIGLALLGRIDAERIVNWVLDTLTLVIIGAGLVYVVGQNEKAKSAARLDGLRAGVMMEKEQGVK